MSELSDDDLPRLSRIRWCPTQFQEQVAGVDTRVHTTGTHFLHAGRVICFEVNPSPALSYYESQTGQPIASAVARRLAGAV